MCATSAKFPIGILSGKRSVCGNIVRRPGLLKTWGPFFRRTKTNLERASQTFGAVRDSQVYFSHTNMGSGEERAAWLKTISRRLRKATKRLTKRMLEEVWKFNSTGRPLSAALNTLQGALARTSSCSCSSRIGWSSSACRGSQRQSFERQLLVDWQWNKKYEFRFVLLPIFLGCPIGNQISCKVFLQ